MLTIRPLKELPDTKHQRVISKVLYLLLTSSLFKRSTVRELHYFCSSDKASIDVPDKEAETMTHPARNEFESLLDCSSDTLNTRPV